MSAPKNPRELLKQLGETFAVFREAQPLAVGISAQVAERCPEIDGKLLKTALYFHTSTTRYLKAVGRGTQRFDLDGNPSGEVTEEHRKHANEQLAERFKKQAEQRRAEVEAQKAEERRTAKLHQLAEKFAKR